MSDSPIKFPSSLSSNEDDLPSHQSSEKDISSDDWMPSDCSPSWSSKKVDQEEEDEDEDEEDDADTFDDDDSNSDSPPPKRARRSYLD
jgi:hypothetical protein